MRNVPPFFSFPLFGIRVSVHPLALPILLYLLFSEKSVYPLILLGTALLHETGHILAALSCGQTVEEFTLLPGGAELRLSGSISYFREGLIAAAGPFFNLVSAIPFGIAGRLFHNPPLLFAGASSLCLAILNLIPLKSFDGSRLLQVFLAVHLESEEKALRITKASELFSLILLSLFSILLVIGSGYNLSLVFITAYVWLTSYHTSP